MRNNANVQDMMMIFDMILPDKLSIKSHQEKQTKEDKDDIKNLHGSIDVYPKLLVDFSIDLSQSKITIQKSK